MNQEDPWSDLWIFLVGSPKPHPATIPSRISTTHATSLKKKNTPHLSNIHDLKIYPTPNKHRRSQKNTPHLSNIRDLKNNPTPNKHPRSTVKKNTPHLTNIRDLNLFSREKFTRKNGKKIRESFVKRLVHLSKGWSICQKVRSICQKVGPFVKRVIHLSKGAVHLSKGVPETPFPILLPPPPPPRRHPFSFQYV